MDTMHGWGMHTVFEPLRNGNTKMNIEEADEDTVHYKLVTKKDGRELISGIEIRFYSADGYIEADSYFNLNPNLIYVPRVGLEIITPAGFEKLSYYGCGENENYRDRLLSARLGVYESNVSDQHFPFIPPSECGGHEETRWLTVSNDSGQAITVKGDRPFHFDARHNTVEDYQKAAHDHMLPKRPETFIHIDAAHMAIGSNMAWSTRLAPEQCVPAGVYHLRFTIGA